MTYFDEQTYETDRQKFIRMLERKKAETEEMLKRNLPIRDDMNIIIDLLRQSKWAKAYPNEEDIAEIKEEEYEKGYEDGHGDGFRKGKGID